MRWILHLAAVIVFAVTGLLLIVDFWTVRTGLAFDSFALAAWAATGLPAPPAR